MDSSFGVHKPDFMLLQKLQVLNIYIIFRLTYGEIPKVDIRLFLLYCSFATYNSLNVSVERYKLVSDMHY